MGRLVSASAQSEYYLARTLDLALACTGAQRGAVLFREPGTGVLAAKAVLDHADHAAVCSGSFSKSGEGVVETARKVLSGNGHQLSCPDSVGANGFLNPLCEKCLFEQPVCHRLESGELWAAFPLMSDGSKTVGYLYLDGIRDGGLAPLDCVTARQMSFEIGEVLGASVGPAEEAPEETEGLVSGGGSWSSRNIIGRSQAIQEIVKAIQLVAPTDTIVLLRGETGTGKELVARAIYHESMRTGNLYVAVNCAALSPTVLESELFGHEKGAFTGAVERRLGRFELANGGTLFLDEIGELPLELQSKLLRAIQEQEFERVGGQKTIKVDVRIIVSTNRRLESMIRQGRFREDLYFRLKVVELTIPPLRKRKEDLPLLASHFLRKKAEEFNKPALKFEPSAMAFMLNHSWPGNIRELENVIHRAVVLARTNIIKASDLSLLPTDFFDVEDDSEVSLRCAEERQVQRALQMTGWNKRRAAKLLEISRTRLDRLIQKYHIQKDDLEAGNESY